MSSFTDTSCRVFLYFFLSFPSTVQRMSLVVVIHSLNDPSSCPFPVTFEVAKLNGTGTQKLVAFPGRTRTILSLSTHVTTRTPKLIAVKLVDNCVSECVGSSGCFIVGRTGQALGSHPLVTKLSVSPFIA